MHTVDGLVEGWKGNWGGTEAVEAEPTKADGTSIPSQCGIGVSYGSEGVREIQESNRVNQ